MSEILVVDYPAELVDGVVVLRDTHWIVLDRASNATAIEGSSMVRADLEKLDDRY